MRVRRWGSSLFSTKHSEVNRRCTDPVVAGIKKMLIRIGTEPTLTTNIELAM